MEKNSNLRLALQLIGDELADQSSENVESVDQVIGRIVRELIRLCALTEPDCSEEVLDGLVRIAATATRAVADHGVEACREEGVC